MRFRAAVLDTDRGWKSLTKLSLGRRGDYVRVGLVGAAGAAAHTGSGGATVVEVGLAHEYGTGTVPERSFLRSTLDRRRADLARLYVELAALVIARRMTIREALEVLGDQAAAWVREAIERDELGAPPLADETLARRGSGPPLVETGQLVAAIHYEIERG